MAAELLFFPKSYIEHLLLSTAPGFRGQSTRARDMAQWVEVLFGMYKAVGSTPNASKRRKTISYL